MPTSWTKSISRNQLYTCQYTAGLKTIALDQCIDSVYIVFALLINSYSVYKSNLNFCTQMLQGSVFILRNQITKSVSALNCSCTA